VEVGDKLMCLGSCGELRIVVAIGNSWVPVEVQFDHWLVTTDGSSETELFDHPSPFPQWKGSVSFPDCILLYDGCRSG